MAWMKNYFEYDKAAILIEYDKRKFEPKMRLTELRI